MTTALTTTTVLDYLRSNAAAHEFFGSVDTLQAEALTEGNVNLLFRVSNGHKSLLVKQALPHSWRYPDFSMPVERARIEYEVLQLETRYAPDQTVHVYWYDDALHLNVLEDLNQHTVLRAGLIARQRYPFLAQHVGRFMAQTLFHTSDLFLSSAEKKAWVPRYINPVMCKVQEDLVFTQPISRHPNNRWTDLITPQVEVLYNNDPLRAEILSLKESYLTHAQALLHNDLHSGSIMLNGQETKVIDPEFAFFGPLGHDVGSYLAHLALNYAGQEYHATDPQERTAYRQWLLEQIGATWKNFEAEFLRLWETEGNVTEWPVTAYRQKYLRQLLQDAAGFGAAEIIRRTVGLAHVADLDSIPDDPIRAIAESLALNIAVAWLTDRQSLNRIEELVLRTALARPTYTPEKADQHAV